jgi:hypothetical protein
MTHSCFSPSSLISYHRLYLLSRRWSLFRSLLHFFFFLFFEATIFKGLSYLSGNFLLIITNDFLFFIDFFLSLFGFLSKSDTICSFYFSNQFKVTSTLFFCSFNFSLALSFNLTSHLFLFFLKHLTLSNAFNFSFLNLVYDN